MSMFNDISWRSKDNKKECEANAQLVSLSLFAKKFGAGQWSFFGPGSEKKVVFYQWRQSTRRMGQNCRKDDGGTRRKRTPSLPSHESFVLRKCSKTKVVENCRYTIAPQKCVKNMNPITIEREGPLWRGQSSPSFVPNVIKTNILLNNDDPAHKDLLFQQYGERIEKLSQQDRLSKFCTDAGFLTTVEVGQYFMTKDTEEFSQFTDSVACREYTLPRDEDFIWTKRLDQREHQNWEATTCCLQGKYGVEIVIKSLNKDNSHSWVRISHGLNKLVTNLNNKDQDDNEQETSEKQFEEHALKLNASDFASRSKAKAKPQRRDSASSSTRTIPIGARTWTDVEPGKYSLNDYPVSKKTDSSSSSWKSTSRQWWSDWILENKRWSSETFCVLPSLVWRKVEEQHGRRRRRKGKISVLFWFFRNNCVPPSSSRSFRTQSYWSFITGQCRDPDGFFKYTYHVGCAIDLLSIINSVLIPGGQILSNRQAVFFLLVDPMDKEHKDPDTIDLGAPRLAQYMHKAWKKHQNTVYWVDINLALKKGLKFYQTRSNAIIFHETLQLIVSRKLFGWKLQKSYTRKYMRHLDLLQRFPWNMIGWKSWVQKLLGNQKEKLRDKQKKVPNQPNQTQIQIMLERGDLLFAQKTRPVPRKSIHVSLVTARTSIWKKTQITIERRDPLFAHKTRPKHVSLVIVRT